MKSPPENGQAGAPEAAESIEVTPEMVEAGAEAIWAVLSDVHPYGGSAAPRLALEVFGHGFGGWSGCALPTMDR